VLETYFSILIPTLNRDNLLGQAIESVLAQTYAKHEIIVIDDGSENDVRNLVSGYGPTITCLRQENLGKAAALNRGIAAAKGNAIIVLDDDDLLPPWALSKHAKALADDPDADFSYGRFARFKGDLPPKPSDTLDDEAVPTLDPRRLVIKLMENSFLPNPTWAVRRAAQLKAGPYDQRLRRSQDYDMLLRLARTSDGVFVDDRVLYQRKHESLRGPLSEQTYAVDTVDKWIKYDAVIFENLDHTWNLSDFRPFSTNGPSKQNDALALLQKGVILFQRKVYDGAINALGEYRRSLLARAPSKTELQIAVGLLGSRYGIADLTTREPQSIRVIAALRAGRWPLLMRMALASQLRWRIRRAVAKRDMGEADRLVGFSRGAFGLIATVAVLGSRFGSLQDRWTELR
jgi:glycosyltransferase involved in cell wall biosynthesis